jgi:hypothetical protein
MMARSERKAAVSAYKERKPVAGVLCDPVRGDRRAMGRRGGRFLDDLDPPPVRARAAERTGRFVRLNAHGAEGFTFKIPEESIRATDLRARTALRERVAHRREVSARPRSDVSAAPVSYQTDCLVASAHSPARLGGCVRKRSRETGEGGCSSTVEMSLVPGAIVRRISIQP